MTLFNRVGIFVAVIGGGVSLVMFAFAGIQYMTASGDPQAMGRAKMALIGAIGGSVVVGLAFIVPGVISRVIIEPSGGQAIEVEVGDDCDQLLRNQLVLTRGASTSGRMNDVIRTIQNQRDACSPELWAPAVIGSPSLASSCTPDPPYDGSTRTEALAPCGAGTHPGDVVSGGHHASCTGLIGGQLIPAGLRSGNQISGDQRETSGRDSDNNILVYWSPTPGFTPTDNALCWFFVRRLNSWAESY